MDLSRTRLLAGGLSLLLFAAVGRAAPVLRLSTAAVGPISIAVGQDGPGQVVEARNAGDGTLALSLEASAAWLVPFLGAPGPCSTGTGTCLPVHIGLKTASLQKGIYTGTVTVKDPAAVDAPQTITVTVQMGGGVPDQADFFVAPNGSSDSLRFQTNAKLSAWTSTQSGGGWLSLALDGGGSFGFVLSYRLRARHHAGMGEGLYHGALHVTGSAFPPDVKDVPVTLRVTSEPILVLSARKLQFVRAAGSPAVNQYLGVANRGLGSLSVTQVSAAAGEGASWLAAKLLPDSNLVQVSADVAGLDPGRYEGTVTVTSNAVNGVQRVPVTLRVVPQSAPVVRFGGVVNNATFQAGDPVPQGGIVAVFGDQFSFGPPASGTKLPLVHELGKVKVLVNGQDVPLYFSSYGQVNFQLPYETPPGEAVVQVERDGTAGNRASVQVVGRAPRLLRLNIGDYGIVVNQDRSFPIPATAGLPSHPAKPGDWLTIYAIGLGPTTPPVASGEAAPVKPLAWVSPKPTVYFGAGLVRVAVDPYYAGLTPNFVGLYQVNVQIPPNAPRGSRVPLSLWQSGVASNTVEIAIE